MGISTDISMVFPLIRPIHVGIWTDLGVDGEDVRRREKTWEDVSDFRENEPDGHGDFDAPQFWEAWLAWNLGLS